MGSYTSAPFSAAGSLIQGQMTSQSLNNQADLQDENALAVRAQAQSNADRQGLISSQKIGASDAAYGASGVTSNSGSVADVIGAGNANAEFDRLNTIHGGDMKAVTDENQATMDRFGAKSALIGSYWSAAGQIAGGTGSAISQNTKLSGGGNNQEGDATEDDADEADGGEDVEAAP